MEQEVADDGGLGSPWLGLLGLAGGGGGGGGGLGGGGGFGIGGGVIDGYVSGATVFWDINSNFIMDANEAAYSTSRARTGYSSRTSPRPRARSSWTTVSIFLQAARLG